jgi:hypothetical protein
MPDPKSVDMSDVIPFRTLSREDFKGANPPPQFAGIADKLGAATCCHILTTSDSNFSVKTVQERGETTSYEVIPNHLRFRAQMDRTCSWWNPKDTGFPEVYVLEHEQIHFALCELGARDLNANIEDVVEEIRATTSTADAATALAQTRLREQLRERTDSLLDRQRDFDEDTSMGHEPEAQKRWVAKVEAELAATAAHASPSR